MLKFIRGRGPHLSAERQKHIKELFAFNKSVPHGFPHRPSALAYDHKLGLLAVATKNGSLRVFGRAGVEFQAELDNETEVKQMSFVANRGQLLLLCEDSTVQLWEINAALDGSSGAGRFERAASTEHFAKEQREGTLKQLTIVTVHSSGSQVYAGTQGGNIYVLDTESLELSDQVIYQDVVLQNVPEEYKKSNPGEVEVIAEQPGAPDKFLIGYSRGLMVLWDNKNLVAEHFYISNQQLESVSWLSDGNQFVSSHNDGSYVVWKVTDNLHPSEAAKIPYGPFPCKAITKIVSKSLGTRAGGANLLIFAGGLPRATYGDKNTVSIIQSTADEEERHHTLDFTSKVNDFTILEGEDGSPKALVILAEEEIVVVDLIHPEWLQFKLPYLSSVHSSAITFTQHYSDVAEEVFKSVQEAGRKQNESKYSSAPWPVFGGSVGEVGFNRTNDLLITGHEDGSIRFWDASGVNLFHLYTVTTSKLFIATDDDIPNIDGDDVPLGGGSGDEVESEWPPFRKVGTFDPYSDDPRLAIRRVILCPMTGLLVVAGTAGQVIVFKSLTEATTKQLTIEQLSVVEDKDAFVWKGHDQLHTRAGSMKLEPGYQPQAILQITPPAAVTAVALHSEWELVAAGTAHGFGLFDFNQNKVVFAKSTLNPADLTTTAGGDALISRRKSFKKSLRESFRRLRKGRSTRSKSKSGSASPTSSPAKSSGGDAQDGASSSKATSPVRTLNAVATADDEPSRPVERQIEARTDDGLGSVIRTLFLAPATLASNAPAAPTLWVGTNAGAIYVFAVTLPAEEKRATEAVACQLGKEIQLKHRAPVIFVQIVDSTGYPIPGPFEVKRGKAKAPSTVGASRVLIASEEQFKLFTLPSLKPYCKSKLTAHEGSRARKVAIGQFVSKSDEKTIEYCMLCMSNQGEVAVYATSDLKRLVQYEAVKREDVHGMSSLVFTKLGEALYLHSPSEFERFSLSLRRRVVPAGTVEVPDGARPAKEVRPPIAAASVQEIKDIVAEELAPAVPEKTEAARTDIVTEPSNFVTNAEAAVEAPAKLPSNAVTLAALETVSAPEELHKIEEEDPAIVTAKLPAFLMPIVAESVTVVTETIAVVEPIEVENHEVPEAVESIETVVVANGHRNGHQEPLNGNVNGTSNTEEDEDDDDDESAQNGNAESPSLLTNESLGVMDITIDSVKDHMTNLTLNENEGQRSKAAKVVTPPPPTEATPIINSSED